MKLSHFYAILNGPVFVKLSTDDMLMCKRDFWQKHRMTPEWNTEIDNIRVEPAANGRAACIVTLKTV